MNQDQRNKTRTVARFAMLTALALVLGYVEYMIPVAPAIPGIKLGLGNTVLLYAVYMGSPLEATLLMLAKVFLSSLRNLSEYFLSCQWRQYSHSHGVLHRSCALCCILYLWIQGYIQ